MDYEKYLCEERPKQEYIQFKPILVVRMKTKFRNFWKKLWQLLQKD